PNRELDLVKPGEDDSQQSLDRSLNSLASFHLTCSHKATKTSTPSVIKLSGGGTAGSGEQLSPGPGPPPPASSLIGGDGRINENTPATDNNDDEAEQTVVSTGTTKSTSAKMEKEYGQANETTMSFVLKLDVEAAAAPVVENTTKDNDRSEEQPPPTLLFAQEIWRSQEPVAVATGTATTITTTGNAMVITSGDDAIAAANSSKSQLLQSLEATSNHEQQIATATTASTLASVKPVVTYPVAKGAREQVQKIITGSQTNTTEILTSRVISQKLSPSSTDQAQLVPVTVNISSQTSTNSTSSPSPNITVASNVQTTLHHKCQPVYSTGTSTTAVKDLQRFYTKSLPSSIISASQSAQKIKTVTNVITNPSTIVAQRNNSLSRSQGAQKTRMLPGQFINNQATANNANPQKIQLGNPTQKTTQPVGATNIQKTTLQPVCNNQKVPLLSGNHLPNLKTQQQKLQMPHKISLTVGRQQLQSSTQQINNVSKSSNLVTGIQKYPPPGQHFMACQQAVRSQSTVTGLQKSQTMATVQTAKLQTTMSNVCKSNSVPNVSKSSQNSNVLKQQIQLQTTSAQLLQGSSQQVIQKSQQQQSANNLQVQRSITNVHSKVIAPVPNNQRTPVMMNSKVQQQQQQQQQQTMMRVGISKGQTQAVQTVANLKTISQKSVVNPAKTTANSQNNVIQQPIIVQRNNNPPQPVKIIQQQQQQNIIGPQNAPQKQSGCIKTIPPQKPVQRNHAQKIGNNPGVKPLLSSNVTGFTKTQGPTATQVAQKTCIKTLLPQQTVVTSSNVITPHKNSPIKIQQQAIQQKQLVMTPQYTQQIRQQAGQIKTLLPITSATIEPRKDVTENKMDNESRMSKEEEQSTSKSPVRRMPLPYECLQFVLQDHNYGAPPPRTPPPPSPPPHPKQQPINGAGSSTATSQHPYIFGPVATNTNVEDDAASVISSDAGREAEPEGEETETAPEGEGDDEDSVTRCICDFEHDDGYMICCDRCLVWQHVDCMGIDRSNIPDEYLCERCRPRRVDRQRARALQMRKREELLNSDMSSDASSTSSADTDVGSVNNATAQKKRPLSQQQSQIPRRNKSDTSAQSSQVRRLNNNNNNNNNNVGKRQRRDSQARQSSTVRKKENNTAPKRGPGKRKAKRRTSLEDKEDDVQDAWGTNMAPLRQWIERYEEAVTNHYSPELRARISNIKVNGTHSDLRQSNMNVVATGKCRLNVHSNNLRFLVATMYLPPNTPIVELRGKYMLSTQHRLQYTQSGRQHVQRPGPFVFFYRLPRDGTEVCVDTRTYGNDARFVRRSCKPNAEVKHCIEKGTLHLYIVTTCAIEKNAEITIKHEQHDLLLSPNPSSPAMPVVCACNNPRECQITNAASQLNRRGSNGALVENADGRERRRRGRRNTVCEETDSIPPAVPPVTSVTQAATTTTSSASSTVTPATPRRTITTTVTTTTTRQVAKEEIPATVTNTQPQTSPSLNQSVTMTSESKKDKKKMTREERKMEAIIKAFERLEKAEQRKQEVQARNAQRKESGGTHSDNEDSHSMTGQSKSSKQTNSERPLRRRRRKGRARTTSSSQSQGSSRRTRLNSAESDVSSGDESNSMQSPPLLSQNRASSQDVPYSSHLHTPSKNTTGDISNTGSSSSGIPTAAGLLLALANSNAPGPPSSPPLQQPTPVKSPTCDSGASSSSQSSTPPTPLSSACLLVAAAVGPLAPGFKFPKTKKVLMNEWLKESPDPPQVNIPQVSPLPVLPPAAPPALQNSMNPLCSRHFSPVPTDASVEFLSQSYAAKSLATLVQAANSVSGICDSPPQRRQQQQVISSNNNNGNGSPAVSTGSAKKRWLRQAISEECDSPNSRPESPPSLSETVAPPKKRRIARESLSSDNYTPPTTPTMLLPTEAAPNNRSLCSADDDYTEHVQSPIVEQTDDRHYDSESIKEDIKVDDRSMDSDKPIIREKLSIDIFPQSEFYVKNEEKTECSDIIKTEESSEMDVDNVMTKKEKVSPKWEGDDIKSECSYDQLDQKIIEKIREAVESRVSFSNFDIKKESFAKEEIVTKGTVEIIDQNEPDTEMEGFSSPIATIEPDAILKQRVVEMQLEFGGGIAEIVNIANSENEKSNDEKKSSEVIAKCEEIAEKSDDNASIDEFDVEAQMKKITGDDGNDYQEKIDTSSEKDKSMDGIEGLMDSSKEDSDSEDKDVDDDKYCESSFKLFDISHEETSFKESDTKPDTKPEQIIVTEDDTKETDKGTNDEPAKEVSTVEEPSAFAALSEESIFDSTSANMDTESIADSPKIFHSIPPLSERIRKKTDSSATPKTPKMDFEAAIIESTISMDAVDGSKNGEQKSMLSTALRELLEAKLDDEPTAEVMKNDVDNEINTPSQVIQPKLDSSEHSLDTIQDSASIQETPKLEETPTKEEETKPKEIKRLKDPRTVVPNSMPAPAFKPDSLPPVKRKLSISEYRKRKQQSSGGTGTEPESSNDASTTDKSGARGRSDSASSGTSSLSSDEEGSKTSLSLELTGINSLTLFPNAANENDEKKGEEGAIGWSAAPTLVERQRENLTERLKREFGLFLSDDEEERARKHGLTTEAILKAHKSPPQNLVISTPPAYSGLPPQLPPQPYIPPPGSASIHYPQFQSKPGTVQYPNFAIPPPTTSQQPMYSTAASSQATAVNKQTQPTPFLVPQASQAPPGSNPYPPQFVPPPPLPPPTAGTTVPITKFPAATPPPPPPPGTQVSYPPASSGQPQKPFFNHPAPRS
ncbi:KMT2E methyltransferase, partial [Acromyrmex insinuator]